jgi:hypothetical protein
MPEPRIAAPRELIPVPVHPLRMLPQRLPEQRLGKGARALQKLRRAVIIREQVPVNNKVSKPGGEGVLALSPSGVAGQASPLVEHILNIEHIHEDKHDGNERRGKGETRASK